MFYYVYILLSININKLYIGFTDNVFRRLNEHNEGKSSATKPFRPYRLIYFEAFLNKTDALHREQYLKSGWGRRSIKKMLNYYLTNIKANNYEIEIIEDEKQ